MNLYETVFIARQDLTNAQVEAMAANFTSIIKTHGGEVSKTEFCGLRNLAYKIKKNKKGHYVLMNIASLPAGITEMERQMKLSEDLLRHLTISVKEQDPNPSKLMQRAYSDDRYRGFDDQDDFGSERLGEDRPRDDRRPDSKQSDYKQYDKPSRPRFQATTDENEGEIV